MLRKIHHTTTSRIAPKTAVRLAAYAVAVELLARVLALVAAFAYSITTTGEELTWRTLEAIVVIPVLPGWEPIAYSLVTADAVLVFFPPFVAVGYLAAVGVVYGVHRRYVGGKS